MIVQKKSPIQMFEFNFIIPCSSVGQTVRNGGGGVAVCRWLKLTIQYEISNAMVEALFFSSFYLEASAPENQFHESKSSES